jgi:hypothetical protein
MPINSRRKAIARTLPEDHKVYTFLFLLSFYESYIRSDNSYEGVVGEV